MAQFQHNQMEHKIVVNMHMNDYEICWILNRMPSMRTKLIKKYAIKSRTIFAILAVDFNHRLRPRFDRVFGA